MSSPSRTKDLQDEHCPSLQPCMSMTPCSNAPRRIVWSSSTSISMPTGSNRTTCLSAMGSLTVSRSAPFPGTSRGPDRGSRTGGPRAKASGPPFLWVCLLSNAGRRSGVDREAAAGAAAAVLGCELLALLRGHLVEEHIGALQRRAAAQVVQRPHLLLVAQLQMRLRGHGLAVVADITHV